MQILAISGSLRAAFSSTSKSCRHFSSRKCRSDRLSRLADLPPFNPNLDNDSVPPVVADFRSQLSGVVISTPEYAHGVPGLLKNALDWLVATATSQIWTSRR
jgi:chromate reductase